MNNKNKEIATTVCDNKSHNNRNKNSNNDNE